jgi:hypothetical protein
MLAVALVLAPVAPEMGGLEFQPAERRWIASLLPAGCSQVRFDLRLAELGQLIAFQDRAG